MKCDAMTGWYSIIKKPYIPTRALWCLLLLVLVLISPNTGFSQGEWVAVYQDNEHGPLLNTNMGA